MVVFAKLTGRGAAYWTGRKVYERLRPASSQPGLFIPTESPASLQPASPDKSNRSRMGLEADPADLQSRFDLALALEGKGKFEEAIDQILEIIRRDSKWNAEVVRKHLARLLETVGPANPRTIAWHFNPQ